MKLRPIAIAVMTLSSAAAFAAVNTSDKSTAASNPGYSTSTSQGSLSSQGDNATIGQLQQALNDKGYNVGTVDGQMGPKTRSALKKFQQAQGLQPSGQIDSQTVAALSIGTPNASTELNSSPQGSMSPQDTSGSTFSPQPQSQPQQPPDKTPS
jgi:peptidoglycan hydrolase-like protein with peptidoglycan-binding domain